MTDSVCTLTDEAQWERLAEYGRLLATAFVSRERTPRTVRWSLRAAPGIEEWARDLARRENACCAFLTTTVSAADDRVSWSVTSIDDPAALAVLDQFYEMADGD